MICPVITTIALVEKPSNNELRMNRDRKVILPVECFGSQCAWWKPSKTEGLGTCAKAQYVPPYEDPAKAHWY